MLYNAKEQTLTIGNIQMDYITFGNGTKTLLMIQGLNTRDIKGSAVPLAMMYKIFAKDYKVYLFDRRKDLPEDITVRELVSYGRIPHKKYFQGNKEEDDAIIEWAIKRTGLENLKDKAVMSMSGGERQRAFIAMALAQKSEILFLDEPTTYLDIYHQVEILELVKELNEESNLTVVMVLHDINQAIRYSDHIIVMKDGEIITKGIPNDVITEEMVKAIYGVDVIVKQDEDTGLYMVPMGI